MPTHFDHILVIDTGGTQAGSIAKKLRALGVASVLHSAARAEFSAGTKGAVIAGNGIVLKAAQGALDKIIKEKKPVLALGESAEAVFCALGGQTGKAAAEDRAAPVQFYSHPLFSGCTDGDRYFKRLPHISPEGDFSEIARAEGGACAFENTKHRVYGAFFTVEKNDPDGLSMLRNFSEGICGCALNWSMEVYLEYAAEAMKEALPSGRVTVAYSGGLLSAVTALIAFYALGDRAQAVMADTGLSLPDDNETAKQALFEASGRSVQMIDIKNDIRDALKGLSKTREKRDAVYKTISKALSQTSSHVLFAAGTDAFSPVEGLFREEVRELGKILGLTEAFLARRPFPGAGLAVRISGEVTDEKLDCLIKADAVFENEIRLNHLDKKLWQYYASLVDAETGPFIVLHALLPSDQVNGYAYRLPYDVIERTVVSIMEKSAYPEGILYDVSGRMAPLFSL